MGQLLKHFKRLFRPTAVVGFTLCLLHINGFAITVGKDQASAENSLPNQQPPKKRFNDVLSDLLNEFSLSLKKREIIISNSISIRKITLTDNIPKSYETLIEGQILERIRKFSQTRVIMCSSCKIKTTQVQNGSTQTTLIANDPVQLDAISTRLGIDTWVDIHFSFHESNMGLIFHAFHAQNKELVWTKTFTSDELYSKKKNADESGKSENPNEETEDEEKQDKYSFSLGLGYHSVPNMSKQLNMLGISMRISEKFMNGSSEVGALMEGLFDPDVLISKYRKTEGSAPSTAKETPNKIKPKPFRYALNVLAILHYHLNPQSAPVTGLRYSLYGALGSIGTPGYLSAALKAGLLLRFGTRFFFDMGGLYVAPATITVLEDFEIKTPGGGGFHVTFGIEI